MPYIYLIAAYVLSVALCIVSLHILNRHPPYSEPVVGDVIVSLVPMLNVVAALIILVCFAYKWIRDGRLPRWLYRLYGGE